MAHSAACTDQVKEDKSMRFQKRIRILPWVHLNISSTGFSFSFGIPGISVNLGKNGTKITAGIPSTGLSDSVMLPKTSSAVKTTDTQPAYVIGLTTLLPPASVAANSNYLDAVWHAIEHGGTTVAMLMTHFGVSEKESRRLLFQMWTDGIIAKLDEPGCFVLIWDASAPLDTAPIQALLNECDLAEKIKHRLNPLNVAEDPIYARAVVIALTDELVDAAYLAHRLRVTREKADSFVEMMVEDGIAKESCSPQEPIPIFDIHSIRLHMEEGFNPWADGVR